MLDKDSTISMVKNIYNMRVPDKSELVNPFSVNKRQRKKNITNSDTTLPDNLENWNSKIFLQYFAQQYKNQFNGIYKKTFAPDCSVINEIIDFMSANELNEKEWTKKFIDWSFINHELISKTSGTFTVINLRYHLNTFFQQVINVDRKSKPIIDIFDELMIKVNNGKTKEILSVYGIPIIATYFINHKDIPENNIIIGLQKLFDSLLNGEYEEQELAKKIVQRSINRSPYPEFFKLKNWRHEFPDLCSKYNKEAWWRDVDYIGNPQFKFDRFMKIE